ncbi:methyltransferase-like protein 24 isoform X2 [Echeneis naucrates]|uniref:methyltransferase-like protein 24 isoform X2 n=1 Tax=Echeneis naucrates TaxID=173247 RepID=UPI001113A80D|nr:methyltransferase-like protein 24 isoform X2 [Echeneis naucrates]
MGRERLSLGLLLRLGALLTAVYVCLHVYLETDWPGSPAPLALEHPIQPKQKLGEQTRNKQVTAEMRQRGRAVKRRISYLRTLKKDGPAKKKDESHESPTPACCPALHPRRKVSCSPVPGEEAAQEVMKVSTGWAVCLDPKYSLAHRTQSKRCRIYSFGLGADDRSLEHFLSKSGCEVHCFDPSLKQPHLQQAEMWLHRLSVDWRDPNPAIVAQRQYANTKKLATILNDFGHRQVDVLKVDMESAEWKILENLVLEGVLDSVGQLLLELHLHWAGFEVAGDDPSVVRYWFSLLKELERADFRLFHIYSDPAKPRLFLHKNVLNASSAYTLSWVNTRWKP